MNRKTFWAFVTPSVAVMAVLLVFPLVTTIWLSFTGLNLRDLENANWIGWDNYAEVLRDPQFWRATRKTLLFVGIVVPVVLVLALAIALLLDRVLRGRAVYLAVMLLPFIVTPVVGALVFKDLFERGGLVAWIWESVTDEPFQVSASNVTWLIIVHAIWGTTPFAMITFFAGLQTLPQERVEAAAMDGARFWRSLWHVTLPHLRVLIEFVTLIAIMDAYRVFDSVFVFTGNRFTDSHTLQVYNFRTALNADLGRVGKGNAIAILTVIGIFVVLIPFLVRSYKEQIAERT